MSGHAVEPEPRCQVCGKVYANGERFCSVDGGAVLAAVEGQTIDGRYRVVRELGKGGMGVVYEAEHVGLDKPVAIKFLSGARDAEARARFHREAKIASRIVHEHVVQIFDVGTHDERDYIVMELVTGCDVRQCLAAEGPFAPARAVGIAVQMLRGLHAIHQAGILHRDIKPANVLLTERDGDPSFVKIMDFGISKSIDGGPSAGTLTDTGKVIGTPQYMAPEQLIGAPADHRADIYATGLTLYAMLAGEAPFASTSFTRVAAMHVGVDAPPVDTFRPGLPRALVAAVAKALAKNPDARFHDAAEMADVLAQIELPDTVPAVRAPDSGPATVKDRRDEATVAARPARKRRSLVPSIAICGFAVIAGILIYRAVREPDRVAAVPVETHAPSPHLASAQTAERDGKLLVAIAEYTYAYGDTHDATLLLQIAGLEERLGLHTEAADSLHQYLAARPDAADRQIVEKRIQMLVPPRAETPERTDDPYATPSTPGPK